jgi:hypothetical protein
MGMGEETSDSDWEDAPKWSSDTGGRIVLDKAPFALHKKYKTMMDG